MKWFTTAILAAAIIATAMTTADAKPRKHRSQEIITCNDRGCSDWAARRVVAERVAVKAKKYSQRSYRSRVARVPARAVDAGGSPAVSQTSDGGNRSVVAVAERYVDTLPSVVQLKQWARETGIGTWRFGRRVYCALGANYVLARAGIKGTGSALARSFYSWGRKTNDPRPGDIAVVRRNHVAVVVDRTAHSVIAVSFNDYQHRILRRTYSLHGPQFRTAS